MTITPDSIVFWQWGFVTINATLVFSWLIMLVLVLASYLITRKLTTDPDIPPRQNLLEIIVQGISNQSREISGEAPAIYVPFVGTLFLYIALANIFSILPAVVDLGEGRQIVLYHPPTGSLSTTAALALCVFLAVPYYGVRAVGLAAYLKQYLRPSPLMLPFNLIGEVSRTLALAVRLFGNVMSGTIIVAILTAIAPLFIPVLMNALGLLTGLVQAYIFAVLAMVYIASATRAHRQQQKEADEAE